MTLEELKDIKVFLEYLQDKIEPCYQDETRNAINDFLEDLDKEKRR